MTIELEAAVSGTPIALEAGVYPAVVEAVESAPGGTFGDQVKIYLRTEEIDDAGEAIILWGWASAKLTTLSKLYGWVSNITGSPPEPGKRFVIDEILTGRPCRVQLSEEQKDGTTRKKVSDILPPAKRPTKPPETGPAGCSECFAELGADGYYTADGKPYCHLHGPRGAEFGK